MNSSVPVGSLSPLTLVRAGCELERSGRSRSERSAHGDTCCSGRTAADLGESPQRAATRIADGVRSFAPAPLQDDMATVVIRVTPAASEVAA